MPRRTSKRRPRGKADAPAVQADIPADRPGLPAPESIKGVEPFVSPQGEKYLIIHTNESDEYTQTSESGDPHPPT